MQGFPIGRALRRQGSRAVCAALAWAVVGSCAAAAEPGAKDLFFADDKPRLVEEKALKAVLTSASAPASAAPSGQASARAPARSSPGVRVWLTEAGDSSGKRKLSPQQTFRTGERFKLWLQANRDGYLYLINVGTSGQTRVMFPRNNQDNRIGRRADFSLSSPLVFDDPPGTEQLVVVLAAAPIDDVSLQLSDGGFQKVSVRGNGSLRPPPAKPAAPAAPAKQRDAASESLDLALADLRGSKDLKFDDDGSELVAVAQRSEEKPGAFTPVVVNLRLTHKR